jgi:glycerophosphoryl diester phosphodiesterase
LRTTNERIIVLSLYFSLSLFGCAPSHVSSPPSKLWMSAHRGDRDTGEENSERSIRSAAMKGAEIIEIDVRRTAGGELVLFHDKRLSEHNSNGPPELWGREVASLSKSERASVRVHGKEEMRTLPWLVRRRDLFGRSILTLDLKGVTKQLLDDVASLLLEERATDRIVLQCPHPRCHSYLRHRYPNLKVLFRAHSPREARASLCHRPYVVQGDPEWLDEELISEIKSSGALVLVKALGPQCDEPATWDSLYARGVDIILTDYPGLLKEARTKKGTGKHSSCPGLQLDRGNGTRLPFRDVAK